MNTFLTMETIAKRALANLYNTTVLASLVYRDFDPDFAGKQGDTITIRKPWVADVDEFDRTAGIQVQEVVEQRTTVSLDTMADVSVNVTSEELTLNIDNFSDRVLAPAMEGIAQKVDGDLAAAILAAATAGDPETHAVTIAAATDTVTAAGHGYRNGDRVWFTALTGGTGLTLHRAYWVIAATTDTFKVSLTEAGAAVNVTADATAGTVTQAGGGTKTLGTDGDTPSTVILSARTVLSENRLPAGDRAAVLSPRATESALNDPQFVNADKSGSTDALLEAAIGRVYGLDSYETQTLGGYSGAVFQRQAVALASRTLELPMGVGQGQAAIESYKGFGIRVVKDYDINRKQDVVSLDFLYGIKTLRPIAAVELDLTPAL